MTRTERVQEALNRMRGDETVSESVREFCEAIVEFVEGGTFDVHEAITRPYRKSSDTLKAVKEVRRDVEAILAEGKK